MTNKQRRIFQAVKTLGPIRPHDLALRLGYSESAHVAQELKVLMKHTLLTKTGKGKTTKYELNEKFKANDF